MAAHRVVGSGARTRAFAENLILQSAASAEHTLAFGVLGQELLAGALGGLALLGGLGLLQGLHLAEETLQNLMGLLIRHLGCLASEQIADGGGKIINV